MLLERFLKYVKIDTQSSDFSDSVPSTKKQFNLLNVLKQELDELGVKNELTETGRLYAYVPGNPSLDPIGVNSHVDTAPDYSGTNVNPQIIKKYDGKRIILGKSGRFLDEGETKDLQKFVGKTLITTDGTTLLGADDKAGLAIIMEALEEVLKMDVNERHPMYILFTPDEEVSRGGEEFDINKFKAKFAYTFDGGEPSFVNLENFNAKYATVTITGVNIHTGHAKGVMVNAALVANELVSMIPKEESPQETCGMQGYYHLDDIFGNVEKCVCHFLLRDFDSKGIENRQKFMEDLVDKLQKKYPTAKIEIKVKDSYSNMMEVINKKPECKTHIEKVFKKVGVPLVYEAIRGGTDGSTFSFAGVPTPNLGTGSYNHHGPYEFAVLEEMELMLKIAIEIFRK